MKTLLHLSVSLFRMTIILIGFGLIYVGSSTAAPITPLAITANAVAQSDHDDQATQLWRKRRGPDGQKDLLFSTARPSAVLV